MKGDSVAMDYFARRAQSRSTFEGHWTRTGDKYEKLADGRYRYCGRTDDMFKVSGVWVAPFEVEQALIAHPARAGGGGGGAARRRRAGEAESLRRPQAGPVGLMASFRVLQEHVKARVGLWKYPRWIEFCEESAEDRDRQDPAVQAAGLTRRPSASNRCKSRASAPKLT